MQMLRVKNRVFISFLENCIGALYDSEFQTQIIDALSFISFHSKSQMET